MNWDSIWQNKGKTNENDLVKLNGFTTCSCDLNLSENITNNIISKTKLQSNQTILEFGCGAGRLSKYFLDMGYKYTGLEKSSTLIDKYKEILKNNDIFHVSNFVRFTGSKMYRE